MMKIYEQTNDLIVREMNEGDFEKFLELMAERGTAADFTADDIKVLWKFRNEKSDIQCTITSIDGKTVYGFCGILHTSPEACTSTVNFFEKYGDENNKRQVNEILTHMNLDLVFNILNT